jgi:hypothetical protein
MEPNTFDWMAKKYGFAYGFSTRRAEEMVWDLKFAILLARLRYRVVPEKLPEADDLAGLARYWKKYYNTDLGAGTREQFVRSYEKYVGLKK